MTTTELTRNYYDEVDLVLSESDFHKTVTLLRSFFLQKGFTEAHTQSRLSILAACEDPTTIQTFQWQGQKWPLPQTGQMWLEYELLKNPEAKGFFCLSTSYRSEPNPIPGRHKTIFPMFEFESKGGFEDLKKMEKELVDFLGIQKKETIQEKDYVEMTKKYGVNEIGNNEEAKMREEYGAAVLLTHFPLETSPFWNMKTEGNISQKIDVIIEGQETIGSAERSTDKENMRELFHTISDGQYAHLLYEHFGKERIDHELNSFLSFDFFPRFGGGIGVNRLVRALKINKII